MAGWAQQAQTALFTMGGPSNADGTPASQASLQAGLSSAPHRRIHALPFNCDPGISALDSAESVLPLPCSTSSVTLLAHGLTLPLIRVRLHQRAAC